MPKVKRFVVKPRTPRIKDAGVNTSKGNIAFDGNSQKILTDESLAREIDTEHGLKGGKRDVYVYQDERLEWHDANGKDTDGINRLKGGHRYMFAQMNISLPDRESLVGKSKVINDVVYVYVMREGKLKLIPAPIRQRGRGAKPAGARNARGT